MKKKIFNLIFALLLLITIIFTLTACGEEDEENDKEDNDEISTIVDEDIENNEEVKSNNKELLDYKSDNASSEDVLELLDLIIEINNEPLSNLEDYNYYHLFIETFFNEPDIEDALMAYEPKEIEEIKTWIKDDYRYTIYFEEEYGKIKYVRIGYASSNDKTSSNNKELKVGNYTLKYGKYDDPLNIGIFDIKEDGTFTYTGNHYFDLTSEKTISGTYTTGYRAFWADEEVSGEKSYVIIFKADGKEKAFCVRENNSMIDSEAYFEPMD